MADDCNTCGDGAPVTDNSEILPSATNTPEVVPPVPVTPQLPATVVTQICTTLKDECHDCAPDPIPFARIKLKNAFALPACDQETEAVFVEDISHLMVGLTLYGLDSAGKTIRLRITKVTPDNKLTLKNMCSSCCGSTKPVGETVIAETYFAWGLPDCCASSAGTDSDVCLVGTFFFPASGATSPANVPNSNIFVLGGLYSLGGFIWKVSARVTSTQILLQNPAPGNGSTVGGFIDGGTDGVCVYPITPISEASECDDTPVDAVTLIGCTPAGKKKLTSTKKCGYVRHDVATGSQSIVDLLGGSSVTGPHYVEWNKDDPCLSKLVSAPHLVGQQCSKINAPLYLTPANPSQEYEIEFATTTMFTSTAPNNIFTMGGRQYTVIAVVLPGTPGILRIKPRFTVLASETVPENTQACVVEGCQPFPKTDYVLPGDLETLGMKVFCSDDGLRTYPLPMSFAAVQEFSHTADIGGIETAGNHDRPVLTYGLVNPSTVYPAVVMIRFDYVSKFRLDDVGLWALETLIGVDASATAVIDSMDIQSQKAGATDALSFRMGASFVVTLAPGQTKALNVVLRLRTINTTTETSLLWSESIGRIATHVTAP